MQLTVVNIVTVLFLANSLFWSLGSHKNHCNVANQIGIKCIPHNYHLLMGVVFFLSTITLVHRKHLSQYAPFLKKLN